MRNWAALTVLALTGATAAAAVPGLDPPASAEACGRCHRAIHEAWKSSAHAKAMESRIFQDALELAESVSGAEARKICLGCHSPIAVRVGDFRLSRKVSWEGVTCDYCHSVQDVSMDGLNPKAKVVFSMVKSGPLENNSAAPHGMMYSPMHTSSAICAPCHEYRNSLGFSVLTTYSEWTNSRYGKEGKDAKACQGCHMYKVAGQVVDPRILETKEARVNLHQMPGSHSIDQLASTVRGRLTCEHKGNELLVFVDVANTAAGHYVPTGSPLRQIVLEVRADAFSGAHFKEQRVYKRTIADQNGKEIDREHLGFLSAAKQISDTRLAPDEKRRETFKFPIAAGTQAEVHASFWYYYSPLAQTEAEKRVTFLALQQLVK